MVKRLRDALHAGDPGSIPGLGRYPGAGNGNLLQYSCLENSMDRGAWWATVHGVREESGMMERRTLLLLSEYLYSASSEAHLGSLWFQGHIGDLT